MMSERDHPVHPFQKLYDLLQEACSGRGPVKIKPSLAMVFASRATEIRAFIELGGSYRDLVNVLAEAGYQTTAGTLRTYASKHKKKVDEAGVATIIAQAITVRTPKRRRTLKANVGQASLSLAAAQGENRAAVIERRASQAPAIGQLLDIAIDDATRERQQNDLKNVNGVTRSFADLRAAVANASGSGSSMVSFPDGKDLLVYSRLHQEIIAGTISSWAEFYNA